MNNKQIAVVHVTMLDMVMTGTAATQVAVVPVVILNMVMTGTAMTQDAAVPVIIVLTMVITDTDAKYEKYEEIFK